MEPNPGYGDLIFDQAGNIYGSTWFGGSGDEGTVYELTLNNGSWMESSYLQIHRATTRQLLLS